MEMDEKKAKCPGSPRFLAWLAKHNRSQSNLDDANRVMGWSSGPDARHGVDCGCTDGKGEEQRGLW